MTDVKSRNRAALLVVGAIFTSIWVMINAGQFVTAALIYIVVGLVSVFFYRQWDSFGKKGGLVGIDKNWVVDGIIGIGAALGLIFLSTLSPFIGTIGIPNVQSLSGTIGRFLIIVIAAPIMEELLFRDFILDYFDNKLVNAPFFIAAVISSVLFALFHLVAYGDSLSAAQGSFITAGLAGLGFAYLRKFTNSNMANITAHMALNIWIGFYQLAVVVG